MNEKHGKNTKLQVTSLFGLMLVIAGIMIMVELRMKTGWLTIAVPGIMGLIILLYGLLSEKKGWLIAGSLVTGAGLGVFFALQRFKNIFVGQSIGYFFMFLGASFFILYILLRLLYQNTAWWSLICTAVFGGAAFSLLFRPGAINVFSIVFDVTVPLGIVFLIWGWKRKLFGLVITGSIIMTTGAGIFFGWNNIRDPKGLIETGIMLVWFSLGWFLITVFSRIIFKKFTWWPLIPGGVLTMVGWGLYIGGNPGHALDFVGNTGSIGLIIFGIYLLLMRFGMQNK